MLSERYVIASVTLLMDLGVIQVTRELQVRRGNKVIAREPNKIVYSVVEKDSFVSDVPNAAAYITIMGW